MPNDAFLSYSHRADFALAAAVEKGLEKLAKPLFSIRAMEVFRDESDLAASSGLTPALEKHLSQSRWLIVFASRTAARFAYCGDEVAWCVRRRGTERLLIALKAIYEARSTGQAIWTAAEDRQHFERYAAAYAAAGGPQQALVEQWKKFIVK